MNREDRAVRDVAVIRDIIKRCRVCRLALWDGKFPYILPLSFGAQWEGEGLFLYFHGARAGKKLDLLRQNPHAAFEMDIDHGIVRGASACQFTARYESVIGRGRLALVEGEEKIRGLAAIMAQYAPGESFTFPEAALDKVAVFRLDVGDMTAKANLAES